MDSMYLDNLDEFINDEKRIVTYRWLSLTLNVPSNVAKQMLYHYYDVNQKKQNSDEGHQLSVNYLLSGIIYDEELKQDVQKICIVQDEELDKAKQSFKQIYSVHIYSIQKTKLKDLQILYGIDHDKIKENVFQSAKFSSLVFPTAKLKSGTTLKAQIKDVEAIKKPSPQKPINIKKEVETVGQNKENKKNDKNTPLGSKKEAKGSLASMFANQTKKQETKRPLEVKQESNSKTKDSSKAEFKRGSLFSFLTKDKPVKKEGKIPSPVKVKEEEEELESPTEMEVGSDSGVEEEEVVKVVNAQKQPKISPKKNTRKLEKPSTNSQKTKPKAASTSKGKRKSSNNSNIKSKRQRIMSLPDSSSDSSSESEVEELMDECPIPSPTRLLESDDEDIIPATPKESSDSQSMINKRRKKKLVDKTFEDEQGFLVTKKEYEYVTDSDDNENPIPTSQVVKTSPKVSPKSTKSSPKVSAKSSKTSPKKSPKKSSKKSPVKSKQASIMSFFKMKT